ncbi:unannotated protein [freshwater metagenome]|uniref:Unannotated protein n=1 Tax=freshwater metagenome TaxID=449393 RepID=A0A6J6VEJ1_9ZZZZ
MLSPGVNDVITNGPAPTGARLKLHSAGLAARSAAHLARTPVGEGIMPGSVASNHAKSVQGTVRVTLSVSGPVTSMAWTKAIDDADAWALLGQARSVSHAGAPGWPARWRSRPNLTASASNTVPSLKSTPERSVMVHTVRSAFEVSDCASRGS